MIKIRNLPGKFFFSNWYIFLPIANLCNLISDTLKYCYQSFLFEKLKVFYIKYMVQTAGREWPDRVRVVRSQCSDVRSKHTLRNPNSPQNNNNNNINMTKPWNIRITVRYNNEIIISPDYLSITLYRFLPSINYDLHGLCIVYMLDSRVSNT